MSRTRNGDNQATTYDRVDNGIAVMMVASENGTSACELRLDGREVASRKVSRPGDIAVCRIVVE